MAQARPHARAGVNIFDESQPDVAAPARFSRPLMLSNVLQSASQTMASIWIGRLISTQALGRDLGRLPDHVSCLFSFVFGVSSGSTVLVGQAFGARRPPSREEDRRHGARRVAVPGHRRGGRSAYRSRRPCSRGSERRPTSSRSRTPTRKVIFLTMPVFFVYFVYTTILRGTGDSTTPFYSLIVATRVGDRRSRRSSSSAGSACRSSASSARRLRGLIANAAALCVAAGVPVAARTTR